MTGAPPTPTILRGVCAGIRAPTPGGVCPTPEGPPPGGEGAGSELVLPPEFLAPPPSCTLALGLLPVPQGPHAAMCEASGHPRSPQRAELRTEAEPPGFVPSGQIAGESRAEPCPGKTQKTT